MSKKSQQLFKQLEAGLGRVMREVGSELTRQKSLGASELAAAIFSGQSNAFVLYGPNQRPGQREQGQNSEQTQTHDQGHAHGQQAGNSKEQQQEQEHEL
jgi:hypothetical protein